MNALVRKEIRILLPVWAGVMVLLLGAICLTPGDALPHFSVGALAVGAILLGLWPFGQECGLGTFSHLLAQPVPRVRIWRVKMGVLGVAMVSMVGLFLAGIGWRMAMAGESEGPWLWVLLWIGAVTVSAASAGGLWTTLLFRQMAAAFWITLLLPLFILTMSSGVLSRLEAPAAYGVAGALMLVYAAAGYWFARHQFLRAQDAQWTGGSIAFPQWRWWGGMERATRRRRRPILALLGKELQLHQSAYVVAALLLVLHVMVLFVRVLPHEALERNAIARMIAELWWVLWLTLPLLIAASSAAEERRLNTQQPQLCLPVRRRTLTTVKFGVVLVLGLVFGALMPALLEGIGARLGAVNPVLDSTRADPGLWRVLATMSAWSAWIVLVALFASSLARHTLQALGLAVGVGMALTAGAGAIWAFEWERRVLANVPWMPLIVWIAAPCLLVVLLWQAFRGAGRLHAGWTLGWRSLATLGGAILLTGLAAAAVHDRAWERVVRLEPRAGPSRLEGPVTPRIVYHDWRQTLVVLLPDGRLWIPTGHEERVAYEYLRSKHPHGTERTPAVLRVPSSGRFIGSSNWVAAAGTHQDVVGLQSDGTLWSITTQDEPRRIGDGSDWRSLEAGYNFFVALRDDGTLWGRGNNQAAQLGRDPKEVAHAPEPIQIGMDDDWTAVFASSVTCTGIKQDGSVWRWGQLTFGPDGKPLQSPTRHAVPEPVRWPWDGSDWRAMDSSWHHLSLILHDEGELLMAGFVPPAFLGGSLRRGWAAQPERVGRHTDWTAMELRYQSFAGIHGGRIVFQPDIDRTPVPWRRTVWRPSRRSDWLAVTVVGEGAVLALAADGTLAFWGYPVRPRLGWAGLLAPSRRPWWTVNVTVMDAGSL
jgi:hypothetical protein